MRIALAFLVGFMLLVVAIPAFILSIPFVLAGAAISCEVGVGRFLLDCTPMVGVGKLASWCVARINP